jgi:hypothetical protein
MSFQTTMSIPMTWPVRASQSNLTGLQAGDLGWPHFGRSPLWKNALARLATGTAAIWTCDWQTESGGRTMNMEVELLKRLPHLFNALNSLIENDGVYLYLVPSGWRWPSLLGLSAVACGNGCKEMLPGSFLSSSS